MIIGRVLAYISFIVMIMVLGAEGLRMLQGKDSGWITISQIVDFLFVRGADEAQMTNTVEPTPTVFENMSTALDSVPAFLVFMIIAILLTLICRRRFR